MLFHRCIVVEKDEPRHENPSNPSFTQGGVTFISKEEQEPRILGQQQPFLVSALFRTLSKVEVHLFGWNFT